MRGNILTTANGGNDFATCSAAYSALVIAVSASGQNLTFGAHQASGSLRAKWAADAEAALQSTVDTARLTGSNPFQTILGAISA